MLAKDKASLEHDLRTNTSCDVRFDSISCIAYSVDASIYEITPIGIVLPRTKEDLAAAVKIASGYRIPVIARGAATGITGGCIGRGLIIDTSKYLNRIIEINFDDEYALVEPGVIQDQLNEALTQRGYRLGPDTSTGDRATLGGMTANNSAGARSLHYGKMVDHVLSTEICLATGEIIEFNPVDPTALAHKITQNNAEGRIYKTVASLRATYQQEIEHRFPKIPRRVSGYNLDELIKPGPLNISKLITGSEGTLGILTKIKVGISKKPKFLSLCIVHFHTMHEGMKAVEGMLQFHPFALEMIDDQILDRGRQAPSMRGKLGWLVGDPETVIIAEFAGDREEDALEQAYHFQEEMGRQQIGYAQIILSDPMAMNHVWGVRKAGLGLLLSRRTYSRAIAFIEDISVAPEKLAPFMEKFTHYLETKQKKAGIYGHVGPGCMHVRPYMDLRDKDEIKLMHTIMRDVSDMLLEFGGAMSGEHGDGLIRSWLNKKMFGEKIYQAFIYLKQAFDPDHLMNPGKIVDGPPLEQNLRLDPEMKITSIPTFLDFGREGGIELAADLCNGNGLCRKTHEVMCPSFQVTGDEYDTTRARAQALRAVIHERLPLEKWTSVEIQDVLDLCVECKGCKTECPSNVDMAKMKAELLYQYQEKHGYSLRSRLFGHIGNLLRLGSLFPSFFNKCSQSVLSKTILGWIGITPKRSFPQLASEKFSEWYSKNYELINSSKKVVLFNDTYTEYNEPRIGIAAIKVLNALGYEVILPMWQCCGRPLISKGLLREAKKKAGLLVETLAFYAEHNIPVIGLEPSCILTLKDDYTGLLGSEARLEQIIKGSKTFDEFVYAHVVEGRLPLNFKEQKLPVKVHGHCHQKALVGLRPTLGVLRAIPGFDVSEIESGCCGMAGSFGYEKEHYEFSLKIGELKLAPVVRASSDDCLIVADGISCRSQIAHMTGRHAYHLAEVLNESLLALPEKLLES